MRVFHAQGVLTYLKLIAASLLCAAFLLRPSGNGPQWAPALLAQPTRPRPPTSTSPPPPPPPTWTPVPPTPTVPTPTPTRRPPTSTPTATYTPTSTPTPTATPNVLATLAARPLEATSEAEVAAASGSLSLSFAQLGYGVAEMTRSQPTRRYAVDLPASLAIAPRENRLLLTVHHFVDSPKEPAALEVSINGSAVAALLLDEPDLTSRTFSIDIPGDLLQVGRNRIDLDLSTEAPCELPGNVANVWIDSASRLDLRYSLVSPVPDLSRYPLPFAEQSMLRIPTTIVLPDRPTSDELTAAMTVAASLGQGSGGAIELHAVQASEFRPAEHGQHHLIAIDRARNNPLLGELALPPEVSPGPARPGTGVLSIVTSPWDAYRLVLVMHAPDGVGLQAAAVALLGEVQALPAGTSVASFGELDPPTGDRTQSPWPYATLASLGYEDVLFTGSRTQSVGIELSLPLGWPLREPGLLVLRFAHAAELDPDRSVLSVLLNGQFVGRVPLRQETASGGQVGLLLRTDLLVPGRNRLEFEVEMSAPGEDGDQCAYLADERLWVRIEAQSEVLLSDTTGTSEPSLRDYPYPFGRTFEPRPTLFVLPDRPNQAVLEYAVQLAARLGSPIVNGHAVCRAAIASDAGSQLGRSQHVIALGVVSDELFRSRLGSYSLPWSGQESELTVGSRTVQLSPDRELGILEVVESPWNGAYALLAVSGSGDGGLGLAVRALLEHTASLDGDLAVVEPGRDPSQEGSPSVLVADTHPASVIPERTPVVDPGLQARIAERWWK